MLEQLNLVNYNSGFKPSLAEDHSYFIMGTCQRTVVLTYNHEPKPLQLQNENHLLLTGQEAYTYLLEIICGLQSKLVGENEIVSQFKAAYKDYISNEFKCSNLLRIIEKLFKDAKEIRSNYLLGLSQKTYSSIARKHIVSKNKADEVLILGSGHLAEDLINQFKKKVKVAISARNSQRVQELAEQHNLKIVAWDDHDTISQYPFIANSIGFDGILFNDEFFKSWNHDKRLFVDLGSPSAIMTGLSYDQGVMKLEDVFKEGAIHQSHKKQQINKAKDAMKDIVQKRQKHFKDRRSNKSNYTKSDSQYV